MARPNAQYPRGKKANKDQDDAKYEEAKEKLENQEKEEPVPKQNKH